LSPVPRSSIRHDVGAAVAAAGSASETSSAPAIPNTDCLNLLPNMTLPFSGGVAAAHQCVL
jgi:hypothetical protein